MKKAVDNEYIMDLIERSRKAQEVALTYSQERVDELAAAIMYSLSRVPVAQKLAKMAYEETGMGTLEAKVEKFVSKLPMVWQDIKNVKTVGIIEELPELGLIKLGKPAGVIGALIPSTNCEATPVFDGVLGLRGRNSVIFAPHPHSKQTTMAVVELMREILTKNGAPADLFLCIDQPSKQRAADLMAACDLVFATGAKDMVRAAYCSGTPAYGVGVGNAAVIIDGTTDPAETAHKIFLGKTKDNASGCSSENSLIIQEDCYDTFIEALKKEGAYLVTPEEKVRLQSTIWVDGHLNREIVARPVSRVAELANIPAPANTTFMLVEETGVGEGYPFSEEKLSLVTTVYKYRDFREAVDLVNRITGHSGTGHSCGIHSTNEDHIMDLALHTLTTKVLVCQPHGISNSGAWHNGLAKTFSLGCGTWGGNIASENITQKHFINTTWVSRPIRPVGQKPFTEEEIFGDIIKRVKLLDC